MDLKMSFAEYKRVFLKKQNKTKKQTKSSKMQQCCLDTKTQVLSLSNSINVRTHKLLDGNRTRIQCQI